MKEYVLKNTEKKCACGGTIAEMFYGYMEPFTMHTPMGTRRKPEPVSDGHCCTVCGILYGGPLYPATKPSEEIINKIRGSS